VTINSLLECLVPSCINNEDYHTLRPINSCQDHQSLKFQFDAIRKLLAKFDSQAKVKEGSEQLENLSIFNMNGHKEIPLKFSQKTFKEDYSYNLDLGKKTPICTLLGEVSAYRYSTLQTPVLIDKLNTAFFPDSVKRKKEVAYLIYKHQPYASTRLAKNGGYLVQYIARNMLNPRYTDSKDDLVIPSTLRYGGNFDGNKFLLKLSQFSISIPVK
ncbi:hypothetical protein HDU77_004328, partial [Chytriomyces hyalinus]